MKQSYKRNALILLTIVVGLISLILYESTTIFVEHVDVTIENLPQELDRFRITHLSDFHGRKLAASGRVMDQIVEANPHIITLTGDYVDKRSIEIQNILPFIKALTDIAPVYAVSGNHDYWTDWDTIAQALSASGVNVLQNEHRIISYQGAELVLAGVSDPFTGNADLSAALPAENGTIVLLAHSPTWFEARNHYIVGVVPSDFRATDEALKRVALTLSGHTHGGQIKLPFIGALSNASGRMFPRDYVEGLTNEGSGWLYISRGLGYTMLPIRLMSRAQVTVLTLRAK